MKSRKLLVLFTVMLVVVMLTVTLLTGGCAKPAPTTEAKTLKIGWVLGTNMELGLDATRLVEAVVPAYNQKGGLAIGDERYNIDLITVDSKFDPETGRAAVEKLISEDKVKFLCGDPTVDAWLSLTEENKVLAVVSSSSPAVLQPENKYVFQGMTLNSGIAVTWAWLATKYDPNLKTVVGLYTDDLKGHTDAASLEKLCNTFGLQLLDVVFFSADTTDFSAYATKIVNLNPDIFSTMGGGALGDALSWKAVLEAGYNGIYLSGGLWPAQLAKIMPLDMSEGRIGLLESIQTDSPPPLAKEAKDAYEAKYGSWDDPYMNFLTPWYALIAGLEQAQSLDPDKVAAVIGNGMKYETIAGPAMMISRPDQGNTRTVDMVQGGTMAAIEGGTVKIIDHVSRDEAFEYIKESGIFGVYP